MCFSHLSSSPGLRLSLFFWGVVNKWELPIFFNIYEFSQQSESARLFHRSARQHFLSSHFSRSGRNIVSDH